MLLSRTNSLASSKMVAGSISQVFFGSDTDSFHFPSSSSGRGQVDEGESSRPLGGGAPDLSRPPPFDSSATGARPGTSRPSTSSFVGTSSTLTSTPSSSSYPNKPPIRSTSFLNLVPRSVANLFYEMQKYRTNINRMTNFLSMRKKICDADLTWERNLQCMNAISTSAILLHRICSPAGPRVIQRSRIWTSCSKTRRRRSIAWITKWRTCSIQEKNCVRVTL